MTYACKQETINDLSYHLLAIIFRCAVCLEQGNAETEFMLEQTHVASC